MIRIHDTIADRYYVEAKIGQGGFGSVYRAIDTYARDGSPYVALKCLPIEPGPIEGRQKLAASLIQREMQFLHTLDHAALTKVHQLIRHRGAPVLVMEYVPGWSFEQVFDRRGPCSEDLVLRLGVALCDVLDYLHHCHPPIIFRDLKPGNIMVYHHYRDDVQPGDFAYPEDLRFKLIDFGIARTFKPGKTRDTVLLGTDVYGAPEIHKGRQTDGRSDIYSLGVTMTCLLAGRRPEHTIPSLRAYAPHVSDELVRILRRATMDDHRSRYQSALAMYNDLSMLMQPRARAVGNPHPASPAPTPVRPPRMRHVQRPARPRPKKRVLWPIFAMTAAMAAGVALPTAYTLGRALFQKEPTIPPVRMAFDTDPTVPPRPTAVPASFTPWLVNSAEGTLYFCQLASQDTLYDIYRVRLDGSQPQQLTSGANSFALSVSSDGQTLAFSRLMQPSVIADMYIGKTDGTTFTQLALPKPYAHHAALSPTGRDVLMGLAVDGRQPFALHRYSSDSPEVVDLHVNHIGAIHWASTDAVVYAASSEPGAPHDLYMIRSGVTERITNTPMIDENFPSLSPKGEFLTFVQASDRHNPNTGYIVAIDLMKPPIARTPRVLTYGASSNPVWSPDGRWIAYVAKSPQSSHWRVWVMRPDGSEARPISPADGGDIFYLSWVR